MLTRTDNTIRAVAAAVTMGAVLTLNAGQSTAEGLSCILNNRNVLILELDTGYTIHCLGYEIGGDGEAKPKDCVRGFMSVKREATAIHLANLDGSGEPMDIIIGNEFEEGKYNVRIYWPKTDMSRAAACSHFAGPVVR
jgi:hypothetical protein